MKYATQTDRSDSSTDTLMCTDTHLKATAPVDLGTDK